MHIIRALSVFVLAVLVGQVVSKCCGSMGECTGVGPCNIFCCNCDGRMHHDLVTDQCRVFVCRDAYTGAGCTKKGRTPLLSTRSAQEIEEEDAKMLHEASGGTGLMTRETFISYSATLGHDGDLERLHARFDQYDLNHDGFLDITEMRG